MFCRAQAGWLLLARVYLPEGNIPGNQAVVSCQNSAPDLDSAIPSIRRWGASENGKEMGTASGWSMEIDQLVSSQEQGIEGTISQGVRGF